MSPTATTDPTATTEALADVQRTNSMYVTAESLLERWADGGREPDGSEMLLLYSIIGDKHEIQRELGRIGGVRRHMRRAGSRKEHEAATKRRDAALAARDEQLPELQRQLEEIAAKIEVLHDEVTTSTRVLDDMDGARSALRDPRLLPKHLRLALNAGTRAVNAGIKHQVVTLEGELSGLRGRLEMAWGAAGSKQQRDILMVTERLPKTHTAYPRPLREGGPLETSDGGWKVVQQESRDRIAEIESELVTLRAEAEKQGRPLQGMRDYYVDRL